ncbi:molybdate ABC transporter substrate-binding protein [Kribbella sp. NBC_01245]|uniref:molybdate ABC transporter substrate-binding protein n=1 Tax=Kribbella sp. NBC_01245 TaxID=2903578 RepID=UPI002E2D7A60|nr:molybdate ABC transporter substrate-binding protein [Kribbella sp. NBC_01245]
MFRRTAAFLTATLALITTACGSDASAKGDGLSGTVTVFAAASLTGTFTQLGKDFEAAHPGVKVSFNFAGSSALAKQITEGAPADVFASAAPKNMAQVTDVVSPVTFATNQLEIAVPKGNPGKITGLADFGMPALKIALCAEQVPCGAAAAKVFEVAGIKAQPDSLEQDVKAALTKVRLGEVDAALVYRTDVKAAADEVEGIEFAEAGKAVNEYPIAVLGGAPNVVGGKAFVDFVRSDQGRKVLTVAGFVVP